MALARVKTYWAEMEATTVAAQDSAIGRVAAEHYFEEVLEGARSIEAQCSKNIIFQWHVVPLYKQCFSELIKAVFILLPESTMMPPVRPFMYICI